MNGIEFLKSLRSKGNRTPFILFTGKGREEVVIEALNEGADFYLQKGWDSESLFAELEHKVNVAIGRRKDEETIVKSNKHLQAAMDLTLIATWSLDVDQQTLTVDDAAWAIIGTDAQKQNGHNITFERFLNDFVYLNDRHKLQKHIELARGNPEIRSLANHFRIIRPDGEMRHVDVFSVLAQESGRKAQTMFGVIQDVTKRIAAEEVQKASELRYQKIVESASEMIFVMQDGVFKMVNPKLVKVLGVNDENELISTSVLQFVHPDDRQIAMERIQRRMRGEAFSEAFGIRMIDKKGRTQWVNNTQVPIEWDGRPAVMILLTDIADEMKIRNEIERNLKFYHSILDLANAPMFFKDDSRRYKECNSAFAAYVGIPKEKILGHTVHELFSKELADVYYEADEQIFRNKKDQEYESKVTFKDGTLHEVIFRKAPYFDDLGEVEGIIGIIFDVTELRRTEIALKMANQKMKLLSEITRHDIKNQLLALDGYIHISENKVNDPGRIKEILAKEKNVSNSIARLIEFTKDYEALGNKSAVWQDVNEIVRKAADTIPMGNIHLDIRCSDLEIFADPLVVKVFINLINNSLKYGGNKMTTIRVSVDYEGEVLHIIYEDDGDGISAEDREMLFTRGFGKHTGLGLFLSREILSITDISIKENGIPGEGARFEIAVPPCKYRHANKL